MDVKSQNNYAFSQASESPTRPEKASSPTPLDATAKAGSEQAEQRSSATEMRGQVGSRFLGTQSNPTDGKFVADGEVSHDALSFSDLMRGTDSSALLRATATATRRTNAYSTTEYDQSDAADCFYASDGYVTPPPSTRVLDSIIAEGSTVISDIEDDEVALMQLLRELAEERDDLLEYRKAAVERALQLQSEVKDLAEQVDNLHITGDALIASGVAAIAGGAALCATQVGIGAGVAMIAAGVAMIISGIFLKVKADKLAGEKNSLQQQLNQIETNIRTVDAKLGQIEEKLAEGEQKIEDAREAKRQARLREQQERRQQAARQRQMFEAGRQQTQLGSSKPDTADAAKTYSVQSLLKHETLQRGKFWG